MIANGQASPREYAEEFLNAGLSVISIKSDGTKSPAMRSWRPYQTNRPTTDEINQWFFFDNVGVAVIHGPVSGNSELIDIDTARTKPPRAGGAVRERAEFYCRL